MVFALSVSGLQILCTNVWSLLLYALYASIKVINSLSGILCNSAILYLVQGLMLQTSGCHLDGFKLQALGFKLRKTLRLSFFNLVPPHSLHGFISSIAWKSTVKSHFTY